MATTIKLKNSVTTTNAPSSLVQGEVAINITDKKVWVGNAATTPIQLLGDGGSVQFTTVDTTNLQVTNIKAKDGTASASIANSTGALTVAAAFAANGGATLGDASGDALTINSSAVSIPNGLNFDSNTLVIDAANNRVGVNNATPTTALDVTGTATISTNLAFTGTGNRITGDFSNGTLANRVAFQTSTTNGSTSLSVIPNGTGANAGIFLESDSAVTNSSRMVVQIVGGSDARITSANLGSGTYLPLTMYTGGSERLRIDTSGNVGIGTSSPTVEWAAGTSLKVLAASTYSTIALSTTRTVGDGNRIGSLVFDMPSNTATYQTRAVVEAFMTGSTANKYGAYLIFSTAADNTQNPTERMRITSGGDLLIGGTISTGARLVLTSTTACGISMGGAVAVNNGASRNVSLPSNAGIVLISNDTTGSGALFYVSYLSATCVLLADPSNLYANSVTAGKISLTKSANSLTVTLTNNGGSNHNFTVAPVFAGQ